MQDILRTWSSALIKMSPMSETKFVTELCPVTSHSLLVSQSNSQSVDPNKNPEPAAKVLLPNDPPGVPHLAPEILSHYCDPVSDSQDDPTINHCVNSIK